MLPEVLAQQERAWNARPLLRRVYEQWYDELGRRLADVPGDTVELGSGIGRFKERFPFVVATDVEPTAWAEQVVDAEALPYPGGSVANLVLIDVFHHLARPARFLDVSTRVLAPGGRILILDPYCSLLSTPLYRLFHDERTDLGGSAFGDEPELASSPLASNQARATLAFFREVQHFRERWPKLELVERRRFSFLVYPLSGGFSRRPLLPAALYEPLAALERRLGFLAPLAAFRCLVVLERAQSR
jgi:SAM-dependent methyltransferase